MIAPQVVAVAAPDVVGLAPVASVRISWLDVPMTTPITEQRYISFVGVSVISPLAAAAAISLSEKSWRGVCGALKVICVYAQSGFIPSAGIASITEINGSPPGSPGSDW